MHICNMLAWADLLDLSQCCCPHPTSDVLSNGTLFNNKSSSGTNIKLPPLLQSSFNLETYLSISNVNNFSLLILYSLVLHSQFLCSVQSQVLEALCLYSFTSYTPVLWFLLPPFNSSKGYPDDFLKGMQLPGSMNIC